MKPAALALSAAFALGVAMPANAQHEHHGAHEHQDAQEPAPAPAPPPPPADPHAGHDGHDMTAPAPVPAPASQLMAEESHEAHVPVEDGHAGHAGHTMHGMEGMDDMEGMDGGAGMDSMGNAAPPPHAHAGHAPTPADPPRSPPPPAALSGPVHAADSLFDPAQMAAAREGMRREHGDIRSGKLLVDQLEAQVHKGRDLYVWKADGWYGSDLDRLWLKTDGEGVFSGEVEHAEAQALWSHALDPWFNLQMGVRQDMGQGPDRTHAVLGIKGLAPYWFEVDAAAFLSNKGEVTARIEAEYDQRLARRVILQPRVEFDFSAQDMPELRTGSGLVSAEAGLRLRYEIVPEFAPYLGVAYHSKIGETATYARKVGEDTGGWSWVFGIRAWF